MDEKKKPFKAKESIAARVAAALQKNKKLEIGVYALIVALIVLLYFSTIMPAKKDARTANAEQDAAISTSVEQETETRLAGVLSNIKGAGHVEVMITYETGPELVTAMSVDTNSNRSTTSDDGHESTTEHETESRKPATVSGGGGSQPIVLTEIQPAVRGVIVVAEGAGDIMVRLNLQRAVQTVLNVPVQSIEVFEMQSGLATQIE